jgi:hypothetical protein
MALANDAIPVIRTALKRRRTRPSGHPTGLDTSGRMA